MSLAKPWVSPEVVDQVLEIGLAEEPDEACGLVFPDLRVMRLKNRSSNPLSSYVIDSEDLVNAIEAWVEETGVDPEQLTRGHFIVWHTHPGGVVGPGPGDLASKVEGFQYVVITLPDGQPVIF